MIVLLQNRGLRVEFVFSPNGDPPKEFMSLISAAERHSIVRITGGCAEMSDEDARDLEELFSEAFTGFEGVLLLGGTRMVLGKDMSTIVPGITEVGSAIRRTNPKSVLLGVIGRAERMALDPAAGVMVIERSKITDPSDNSAPKVTTIVQSDMDAVAVLQERITRQSIWHDEALFCAQVTEVQRRYGKWDSALIAYNGGATTGYEIELVARLENKDCPVILIRGSGRAADTYAADDQFLRQYPNVIVCDKEASSLRDALVQCSVIEPPPARERLRAVS